MSTSGKRAWVNGIESPADQGFLCVDDLGLQRGIAVFEYMRSVDGRLFRAADHFARLHRSAGWIGLKVPYSNERLVEVCAELVGRSKLALAGVRVYLTGGYDHISEQDRSPNLVLTVEPLPSWPEVWYQMGISLATVEFQREMPGVKTTNYLQEYRLRKTTDVPCDDFLYVFQGNVLEAPRSNFFAVIGSRLVTPENGVLHGITRMTVIETAKKLGVEVENRELRVRELADAREAFITSTTKGILPVANIDNQTVGTGEVGTITAKLMSELRVPYTADGTEAAIS